MAESPSGAGDNKAKGMAIIREESEDDMKLSASKSFAESLASQDSHCIKEEKNYDA